MLLTPWHLKTIPPQALPRGGLLSDNGQKRVGVIELPIQTSAIVTKDKKAILTVLV